MQTLDKYQNLDAAIIDALSQAPKAFYLISANTRVSEESETISLAERETIKPGKSPAPAWRIVDRRLQALRKKGAIISTTTGWIVPDGCVSPTSSQG